MNIPKQFKSKKFRFIKLRDNSKKALEADFQLSSNYKYTEKEFEEYLDKCSGYGILGGYGKLAIIDCDDDAAELAIKDKLPDTFTVRTGSGGCHLYYIIPDMTKKIVMKNNGKHYGEVQFTGTYVVGPGSIHPDTGNTYEVETDKAIKTITKKELLEAINPFVTSIEQSVFNGPSQTGYNLDITKIAEQMTLSPHGDKLIGPHPIHGSDNGQNFEIDLDKNLWHCYRCETGGDTLTLIALLEGIIKCEDCKPGALKGNKFKEVVKLATDKYGYEDPMLSREGPDCIRRELTKEEVKALKSPTLLFDLLQEVSKEGVVGEERAQLGIALKIALRLVTNATETSSNLIVSDKTGGGKDHLVKNIAEVMLEKEQTCFHCSAISEKVLNYWHPNGEQSSWDGRVLYIEDPDEEVLKMQAFKVRASGSNELITLNKDRKYERIIIRGKPVMIVTSMNHNIDTELQRRWSAVRVDTSETLTKQITQFQFKRAAGLIPYNPNENLRNGLKNLNRVEVVIPFAEDLIEFMPSTMVMRSQNLKLLDYIKASAALHQYQRKQNKQEQIIAEWEDYAYAIFAFNLFKDGIGAATDVKEQALLDYLLNIEGGISKGELAEHVDGISTSWVYRRLDTLKERGLVAVYKEFSPAANKICDHVKIGKLFHDEELEEKKGLKKKAPFFKTQLPKLINERRKKNNLPEIRI